MKSLNRRLTMYVYETLYDIWLWIGCHMWFIETLLSTQDWVWSEWISNRKVSRRSDFKRVDEDYGK
jgi:hypothetical protein